MPSIEYSGMKVTGGKVFAIFTLLGALGGAAWTGFTFYMRSDIKADLRHMNGDIRHITEIVNDVEDRQKEDARELLDEMKLLEESLDLKINKALNNPLNNMSAKN